jgi:hypothetical protein
MEYIINKNKNDIKDFINKYKNKTFTIKNNDIEFQVKLIKHKSIIKSKLDYYSIETIELSQDRYNVKYIFKISFLDPIQNKPSFENILINNISKSEKYSGSIVVNFVIDFLKSFIQIKKLYLGDRTTVNCKNSDDNLNLSLYKLITSNIGFYQKFGFRLITQNGEDINNNLINISKKVSNYKVNIILNIFLKIIKLIEKHKKNITVKCIRPYSNIIEENKLKNISLYVFNLAFIIFALEPYKKYTFGECVKKMNEDKCFMLSKLLNRLTNDIENGTTYFEFKFEKEKIKSQFLYDFYKLCIYSNNFQDNGFFMKKL